MIEAFNPSPGDVTQRDYTGTGIISQEAQNTALSCRSWTYLASASQRCGMQRRGIKPPHEIIALAQHWQEVAKEKEASRLWGVSHSRGGLNRGHDAGEDILDLPNHSECWGALLTELQEVLWIFSILQHYGTCPSPQLRELAGMRGPEHHQGTREEDISQRGNDASLFPSELW
ncbi:hypothetical protein SRHO_G00189580 [Serrasalmus rhombeus]